MWSNIIGSLFIVSGVLFAINPERLRRKLQKKSRHILRRYFVVAISSAGIVLITAGWEFEGVLAKLFILLGLFLLLKGALLLKAKSIELIAERLLQLPAVALRLFAAGQISLGILLILLHSK